MTNNHTLPTLDLAIATHRPEGILRVAAMHLPVIDGVRYVVSWQNHRDAPIPASLIRDDVEIHRFDGKGLSLNRNNALDHCRAEVVLFADDDITVYPGSLSKVRELFRANPEVDLFTFRYDSVSDEKRYPQEATDLTLPLPKNYSVCSIEIAFRRETGLCCHPLLGLGAPHLQAGEDEALLLAAIRRGLVCRYYPLAVCRHDGPSTGSLQALSKGNLQGLGGVIALMYPKSCWLRMPLKAWRVSRKGQAPFFTALRWLAQGSVRGLSLLPDKKYLW